MKKFLIICMLFIFFTSCESIQELPIDDLPISDRIRRHIEWANQIFIIVKKWIPAKLYYDENSTVIQHSLQASQEDADDVKKATYESALVGAIGGGIIGQVIGNNTKSTLLGATIGGVVVGSVGNLYAKKLVKRRSVLRNKKSTLQSQITEARATNEELKSYIAELDEKIAVLDKEIQTGKAKGKELEMVRTVLKEEHKKLSNTITEAEDNLQILQANKKKSRSKAKNNELDQEIRKWETHLAKLKESSNKLASINRRVEV